MGGQRKGLWKGLKKWLQDAFDRFWFLSVWMEGGRDGRMDGRMDGMMSGRVVGWAMMGGWADGG